MDKLQQYKKEVDVFLASFLASKQKGFARVNAWGPDALDKIKSIVSEGKTIRGSLVLLVHDILHGHVKNDALRVAAAYELIQTGLLIHDDIMDHDTMRRGKPTVHVQYKSEPMAMCVGDICFFLAHELLSNTSVDKMSAEIFQEVGIAQMEDVARTAKSKEEIVSLYRYKTARYTSSLPMMAGAILARANNKSIHLLEKLGEDMGILFQIQDDRLDNEKNPFTDHDIEAYKKSAEQSIARLTIQEQHKIILQDLVHFAITRLK
jgi:geranylgeranyl diphosphate synthase type I